MDGAGPVASLRPEAQPTGPVWSLWDMLKLHAKEFYDATTRLNRLHALVRAEKEKPTRLSEIPLSNDAWAPVLHQQLANLGHEARTLGASLTVKAIERLLLSLEHFSLVELDGALIDVDSRLQDELSETMVFALQKDKHRYFEPTEPLFGPDVQRDYQSAQFEIDEAGKCLALERSTAAVFHLMRTMEIGILAVARCLGIPDPVKPVERNWGAILRSMKVEMDARNAAKPKRWSRPADTEFFEEVYASLDAVRNVWRNGTMHVERVYTPEDAEHIFGAVRGFMRKIASRFDEAGQPAA